MQMQDVMCLVCSEAENKGLERLGSNHSLFSVTMIFPEP